MGPTPKKNAKQNQNILRQSKQRESVLQGVLYFLKFLVFKSSFSDSRVSVRQNSSG